MSDRYTKIVLTVIAVCLLKIAFSDLIAPAEAQGGVQRVAICDKSGSDCASVTRLPGTAGGAQLWVWPKEYLTDDQTKGQK